MVDCELWYCVHASRYCSIIIISEHEHTKEWYYYYDMNNIWLYIYIYIYIYYYIYIYIHTHTAVTHSLLVLLMLGLLLAALLCECISLISCSYHCSLILSGTTQFFINVYLLRFMQLYACICFIWWHMNLGFLINWLSCVCTHGMHGMYDASKKKFMISKLTLKMLVRASFKYCMARHDCSILKFHVYTKFWVHGL